VEKILRATLKLYLLSAIIFAMKVNYHGSVLYLLAVFGLIFCGALWVVPAPAYAAAVAPSIADASSTATYRSGIGTSDSFTYTVPSNGTNKLLVVVFGSGGDKSSSINATQNGASLTCANFSTPPHNNAYEMYCYLPSPSTGTFSISWSGSNGYEYSVFTLQDAAQTDPIDVATSGGDAGSVSSNTLTITTNVGNDALLDMTMSGGTLTGGTGQTVVASGSGPDGSYATKQLHRVRQARRW
jgi:hypothetical protein